MKIQRWLGLVAAVSILQLNVRVAYAACGLGDPGAQASAASGVHHHEEPASPVTDTSPAGENEAPGELPVSADCCQAMASCGASVIVNQVTTPVDALASAPAIAARGKIPHGRITAPEPPPPKA